MADMRAAGELLEANVLPLAALDACNVVRKRSRMEREEKEEWMRCAGRVAKVAVGLPPSALVPEAGRRTGGFYLRMCQRLGLLKANGEHEIKGVRETKRARYQGRNMSLMQAVNAMDGEKLMWDVHGLSAGSSHTAPSAQAPYQSSLNGRLKESQVKQSVVTPAPAPRSQLSDSRSVEDYNMRWKTLERTLGSLKEQSAAARNQGLAIGNRPAAPNPSVPQPPPPQMGMGKRAPSDVASQGGLLAKQVDRNVMARPTNVSATAVLPALASVATGSSPPIQSAPNTSLPPSGTGEAPPPHQPPSQKQEIRHVSPNNAVQSGPVSTPLPSFVETMTQPVVSLQAGTQPATMQPVTAQPLPNTLVEKSMKSFQRAYDESRVQLKKPLSGCPQGVTVLERHKLDSLDGVEFFEECWINDVDNPNHTMKINLSEPDHCVCFNLQSFSAENVIRISYSNLYALYKLPDGTCWAEHGHFWDADDLDEEIRRRNLDSGVKKSIILPDHSSLELIRRTGRFHTRTYLMEDECYIYPKPEYDRLKMVETDDTYFWRVTIDENTLSRVSTVPPQGWDEPDLPLRKGGSRKKMPKV